jgi:hypothetical protein
MPSILPYSLYVAVVSLVLGCSKSDDSHNQKGSDYFPNKIGDTWEYQVFDSSDSWQPSNVPQTYTVKVSITGTQQLLDGQTAAVWTYESPNGKRFRYVTISGDSVKVYDSLRIGDLHSLLFPDEIFIIPLKDDQAWTGKLLNLDFYEVASANEVTNDFGNFGPGFIVSRRYAGPNIQHNDLMIFVPQIGLVNANYIHFDFAPITRFKWQLKKYLLH